MHLYTEYKSLNDTKITRKTMLNIERIHKNIHNFETSTYFTVWNFTYIQQVVHSILLGIFLKSWYVVKVMFP